MKLLRHSRFYVLRSSFSLLTSAFSLLPSTVLILSPSAAFAQTAETGIVTGQVVDALNGDALPGAMVTVQGMGVSASTQRDGSFRLVGVPSGPQTLVVTYLGRDDFSQALTVAAGGQASVTMRVPTSTRYEETVSVSALILDAQARALNQQKTAPNITNIVSADQLGHFPDPNAAETTQRIPGVSIQRDMGEGRYVIVRGTEPRLNSTLIDGERIPAPEANVRQVALDVIPADLLQAVEVSKALTPDMDGDAIGGTVNLVMKDAPDKMIVSGTIGGGYNIARDSYRQPTANVTAGGRMGDGRAGYVVSASMAETARTTQDFEPVYTAGNLTDLDLRNYAVNRRRHGLTGAFDFRPDASQLYKLRAVYNHYIDDHEERQRVRQRVANRRIERELRDRTHIEHIWSLAFTGDRQFGGNSLSYRVSGAHADQKDPLTIASVFRQSNVNFSPNVTPDAIDPDNIQANPSGENLANSAFNQQTRATNFAGERDVVTAVDLRMAAGSSPSLTTFFKVGVKYRDKAKERTRDEFTLTSATAIPFSAVSLGGDHSILDGRYALGPFLSLPLLADLPNNYALTSVENHARDTEDFNVTERVAAVYGQAEFYVGSKLFILPGVRVERTGASYQGKDVSFSPTGVWLASTPNSGAHDYVTVLPGVNLRYAVDADSNIRAAVTRSMARPNYFDLVPYRSFNDADNTIALGNPDLQPTRSWNYDLMYERYLRSVGVLSAGVFHKQLQDYIYSFVTRPTINGEQFTQTQAQNGEAATLTGLELAAQSRLSFLPGALDGIGLYANYTFTDSSAEFPGRTGEQSTLPGQSRHVGNLSASYEKFGFAGRLAVNFHGSYVDQVAAASGDDRFYDTHKQVDLSLSQRVNGHFRLFFDALNLTDAPLRYYQGVSNRPLQEEHYKTWLDFGVKVEWR